MSSTIVEYPRITEVSGKDTQELEASEMGKRVVDAIMYDGFKDKEEFGELAETGVPDKKIELPIKPNPYLMRMEGWDLISLKNMINV
ncbi:hypothetical protein SAMD00019534_091610 [Acytostelium subglobosum LB1]|uniref:hypothetical protein n=1 Tax=Acytostelium subglobosum LB1 TaxID=1410327 RepID=UPI00064504EE|nr:hypothetical protein SAMD00019534_091610 [Acytostelium subglobosum LB1]GAM25986.1 hypothetical protein SAMD00019534_091610 [Acytostelium subglobosum LB1]|eukprot:XP_012751029.1 hypothetical protein SAMD00019534_091610 [Acytostelium subglobosum LB1]